MQAGARIPISMRSRHSALGRGCRLHRKLPGIVSKLSRSQDSNGECAARGTQTTPSRNVSKASTHRMHRMWRRVFSLLLAQMRVKKMILYSLNYWIFNPSDAVALQRFAQTKIKGTASQAVRHSAASRRREDKHLRIGGVARTG